jgi:hypothetical protein
MKKLSFIIILFLGLKISAQTKSVSISGEFFNVFYVGLNNPITIASTKPYDSINVINGTIKKEKDNLYNFLTNQPGETTIQLLSKNEIIHEQKFRCKPVPIPELKIGDNTEKIELNNILAHETIGCSANGFIYDGYFLVISYEISYKSIDGKMCVFKGIGNAFTKEFKKSLLENKIKENDNIFIDAKVKTPEGKIINQATKFKINY